MKREPHSNSNERRRVVGSRIAALLMAFPLALTTPAALAALVTVSFQGTINTVDLALSGSFSVGQTISGTYTYNSATANSSASTNFGNFRDAITVLSGATSGGYTFGLDASSPDQNQIALSNNLQTTFINDPNFTIYEDVDAYYVFAPSSGGGVSGLALESFGIELIDLQGLVFGTIDTEALGETLPPLSEFELRGFFLQFLDTAGEPFFVSGDITSINVPEPATFALFGLGLAGIPFVRRRRTPA
jgi:hypothetical protein